MRLKNIKLAGFKSFAEEIRLDFNSGITGIIGPNGCGKSNISDGIRWVLGEQSSKILRGTKMDELIFSGSQTRRAGGMAEVTLNLADIDGAITSPTLSSFEEISITRRLFKSGESEYLINNTPCRLKDIVDIFLDTGLSARNLSVIDLALVNRIMNSKPADRRFLIEEAAGTMKYRQRRKEALGKLTSSKQNLVRVNDIVKELSTQMNSLRRQAKKAERYKSHKEEIRNLNLSLTSAEIHSLKSGLAKESGEKRLIAERETELSANSAELKNRLEILKTELLVAEKEAGALRQSEFEGKRGIEEKENIIRMMEKQIEEIEQTSLSNAGEINSLNVELTRLSEKQKEKGAEIAETDRNLSEMEKIFREKKAHIEEKNASLRELKSSVEISEREMISLISSISQKKNLIASIEARLEASKTSKDKLSRESKDTLVEKEATIEKIASIKQKIEEINSSTKEKRQTLDRLIPEEKSLKGELDEVENKKSSLRESLAGKEGLLNSLVELKDSFEGFGNGVKSVMAHKESGHLQGIEGLLVDHITTDARYETAIETAIGNHLSGIVVNNSRSACQAVKMLKETREGKGVFIPSEALSQNSSPIEVSDGDIIGTALSLVRLDGGYEKIARHILHNVLIAESLERGLAFKAKQNIDCIIVTLDGDIIGTFGTIIGGREKGGNESLLARKRRIGELKGEIEKDRIAITELDERSAKLKVSIEQIKEEIKGIELKVREEEIINRNNSDTLTRLNNELDRLEKKIQAIIAEMEKSSTESTSMEDDHREKSGEIADMELKRETVERDYRAKKETIVSKQSSLDSILEEAKKVEIELTSLRGRSEHIRSSIEQIKREEATIHERIRRINEVETAQNGKKEGLKESIGKNMEEIRAISLKMDSDKALLRVVEEAIAQKRDAINHDEEVIKGVDKEGEELRDALANIRLKCSETEIRIEHLNRKIVEEFNIEPNDIPAPQEDGINREESEKRIALLRSELEKYGEVNLTAISEYEKVKERYDFLFNQENDLNQSIANLEQTIEKIDTTTTKMFNDTFEAVNENFGGTFRKLFRGGKADLVITEGKDGEEEGIDIVVQPPGKKLQSLSLLSAGERAMTTISLLFSIFMLKPGPFCLLDEIDAPLDEVNIGRFKAMLAEMNHNTQFIVITHNQKTMMDADVLYGVTMEEDGVSKVVSVSLKGKKREQVTSLG
ncbi:MAG: chromosome segregation protein SMC [Nitrospinota bacterium]|nr:chromosome segregation protein SMC [Nitrospinota bacterium]